VAAAFQKRLPVVICPGCNKPMKPGKPKAIAKASVTKDLADITYGDMAKQSNQLTVWAVDAVVRAGPGGFPFTSPVVIPVG